MPSERQQLSVNKWAARVVPALLLGATGYAIYVLVEKICIEYLIDPSTHGYSSVPERSGIAVPILVFFFVLLLLYLGCYARLIYTIAYNPGYTTRIPHPRQHDVRNKKEKSAKNILACGSLTVIEDTAHPVLNRTAILQGEAPAPPGIEYFSRKDVFICDPQGLPLFCDICNNFKFDRTHHCSEVDRCVRRMDHFCPWVGGIVSETNIKFFLQFLFYAAAWGIYTLGFTAWAVTDRIRSSDATSQHITLSDGEDVIARSFSRIDGEWIAVIALVGLLGVLFAGGMFLTTLYNAAVNQSTNEQIFRRSYNIAVRLPRRFIDKHPSRVENFTTITYPLRGGVSKNTHVQTPRYDEEQQIDSRERTFAILQSRPADNIWYISTIQNLKSVLGDRYIDWLLPLNYPPCVRHDDIHSDYPLGPDFERLCGEAGIR